MFVCFVCDARHAFRGRGSERGVRGVDEKPSTGRYAQRRFRGVPGPGRGDTEFRSIYGAENGRKMEKLAKTREILEKSHDPNPAGIMLFGATDDLLKIETLAKMHLNYQIYFLFFSVHVLLFYLYFFYWRRCIRQRCTGPLVYTIKSGVLFCFVLFCLFVCL